MNASELIASFQGKRILVAGDVMLDEYILGSVQRISPEAPVPVLDIQSRRHVAGGAANVAANIAGLGGRAMIFGLVGEDESAEYLRAILREQGVDVAGLVCGSDRPTITKTRVVSGQQQIVRLDREARQPVGDEQARQLLDRFRDAAFSADACILSDYAKGVLSKEVCRGMLQAASGIGTVVDPKSRDFSRYRGCTVVTPNVREAEQASHVVIEDEATLQAAAEQLQAGLPGSAILITRGADGMTLFPPGLKPFHVPAIARQVFDVTGAGDTVGSVLALALAAQATLEGAVTLANAAAGVVVQKLGTATLTAQELAAATLTARELNRQ